MDYFGIFFPKFNRELYLQVNLEEKYKSSGNFPKFTNFHKEFGKIHFFLILF